MRKIVQSLEFPAAITSWAHVSYSFSIPGRNSRDTKNRTESHCPRTTSFRTHPKGIFLWLVVYPRYSSSNKSSQEQLRSVYVLFDNPEYFINWQKSVTMGAGLTELKLCNCTVYQNNNNMRNLLVAIICLQWSSVSLSLKEILDVE
jgi:hypothetical protein